MNQGGLIPNWGPNVYRTVTAAATLTNLAASTGVPKRCACFLNFTNTDVAAQTANFTGPDGVTVPKVIPPGGDIPYYGDFATIGVLGANVTVVAGWVDDGLYQKT